MRPKTAPRAARPKRQTATRTDAVPADTRVSARWRPSLAFQARYSWYKPYPATPAAPSQTRTSPAGSARTLAVHPPGPLRARVATSHAQPERCQCERAVGQAAHRIAGAEGHALRVGAAALGIGHGLDQPPQRVARQPRRDQQQNMASERCPVHRLERAAGIGGPTTAPAESGSRRQQADRSVEHGLGGIPDARQDLDPGRHIADRGLGGNRHRRRRGLAPAAIWAIVRPVVTDVRYRSTGSTSGSA